MDLFLDTSALIKLYHNELYSKELIDFIDSNKISSLVLSQISKLEFRSAIWRKVRQKEITEVNANLVIDLFMNDYSKFIWVGENEKIFETSSTLIQKYGIDGLRTLDSIQLNSALIASYSFPSMGFITFDLLLQKVFKKENLNVIKVNI
jgi:predicted nucleic acid-binding protein